jgi:hypothetical protein
MAGLINVVEKRGVPDYRDWPGFEVMRKCFASRLNIDKLVVKPGDQLHVIVENKNLFDYINEIEENKPPPKRESSRKSKSGITNKSGITDKSDITRNSDTAENIITDLRSVSTYRYDIPMAHSLQSYSKYPQWLKYDWIEPRLNPDDVQMFIDDLDAFRKGFIRDSRLDVISEITLAKQRKLSGEENFTASSWLD